MISLRSQLLPRFGRVLVLEFCVVGQGIHKFCLLVQLFRETNDLIAGQGQRPA